MKNGGGTPKGRAIEYGNYISKNDRIDVLLFPLTRSSQERTRPLPEERKKERKSVGLHIFPIKPDVLVFLSSKKP